MPLAKVIALILVALVLFACGPAPARGVFDRSPTPGHATATPVPWNSERCRELVQQAAVQTRDYLERLRERTEHALELAKRLSEDASDAELAVALDDRLENLADVIPFTYPPGLLCEGK
jgi:hypothetical protein